MADQPLTTKVQRQKCHRDDPRRYLFLLHAFASGDGVVAAAAAAAFVVQSPVVPFGVYWRLNGFLPTRSVLVGQATTDGTTGSVTTRQQPQQQMTWGGQGH